MLDYLGMAPGNITPDQYIKESKKRKAERDAEAARETGREVYGKKTVYDLDEEIRTISEILALPSEQKHEAYRQYMTAHGEDPDTLGVYLNDVEKKRVGLEKDEVCCFFEVGRKGIYSIDDVMRRNARVCPELDLRVEQVTDIAGNSYFILIGVDVETMNLLTRKHFLEQGKHTAEQPSQQLADQTQPQVQDNGIPSGNLPQQPVQQARQLQTQVQQQWQRVVPDKLSVQQTPLAQPQKQGNAPSDKFAQTTKQTAPASYVEREHVRTNAPDYTPSTCDR